MRCISCEQLSCQILCDNCQENLLTPAFYKRELTKDFFVYSFYKFEEVKELLSSKYHFYGDRVYKALGKIAFKKFSSNFEYPNKVIALPVDDRIKEHFSHTAILAHSLKIENIQVVFNTLQSTNNIQYAGKPLEFRKKNKRDFLYRGAKDIEVILIDDVVTTGTTLLEAKKVLEKNGCKVLFALTLSDATDEKIN